MNTNYTILLPFTVSAHAELETPIEIRVDSYDGAIVSKRGAYAVEIHGIASEIEALELLRRVATGLLWVSIDLGVGIRVNPTRNDVTMLAAPAPPESMHPGATAYADYGACVYPEGTNIALVQGFPASRIFTTPPNDLISNLVRDSTSFPNASSIWEHPRIPIAMSMFADSHFQSSSYAGFLAYINVLEILKEQESRSTEALRLVDEWIGHLDDAHASGDVSEREYRSMRTSLTFQRETSINQAIRELVTNHLGDDAGREATQLYAVRSQLIHGESVDDETVRKAHNRAKTLVRDLLRSFLQKSLK